MKILKLIFYYLLLLLGLAGASWIIWSRFIRQRTIRDIPDSLLTEYRFWILLYICFIYLYVVKSLIKPKDTNIINPDIINFFYKPLITLDHFIKYNKKIKPYYYKLIIGFVNYFNILDSKYYKMQLIIFFMQIFPRMILVSFLLLDTFYFNRIEIFYKVVLIGLLPFLHRYIKYSLKDIYEQWILALEKNYDSVIIYEKDYQLDKNREAIYHQEEKTIREYIEIKYENIFDYYGETVNYQYESYPLNSNKFILYYIYEKYKLNRQNYKVSPYKEMFLKTFGDYHIYIKEENLQNAFDDFIAKKYVFDKYNFWNIIEHRSYVIENKLSAKDMHMLSSEDLTNLKNLYNELMPSIINLKLIFFRLEIINDSKIIKWSKIVIFSLYFISWFYILIISYLNYPNDFDAFMYLVVNFMRYLSILNDPFADENNYSINKNLITKKIIKSFIIRIKEKINKILKNEKI